MAPAWPQLHPEWDGGVPLRLGEAGVVCGPAVSVQALFQVLSKYQLLAVASTRRECPHLTEEEAKDIRTILQRGTEVSDAKDGLEEREHGGAEIWTEYHLHLHHILLAPQVKALCSTLPPLRPGLRNSSLKPRALVEKALRGCAEAL